jgi:hypothetical protein
VANPAENGLTVADLPGSDRAPSDLIPSGRLELFEEDYRNPRFWRSSIGVDQELPGGFIGTLEAQYSKTLKNVLVTNVNLRPSNEQLDGPDNRPIWVPSEYDNSSLEYASGASIDSRYANVLRVGNTDQGYSYNVTARLRNSFENLLSDNSALRTDVSYTYGDSYAVNDGLSSQVVSLWNGIEHVNGANNIGLARSDFSTGHRILGRFSYKQQFLDNVAATLSLIYEGQSGTPFSYVIGESGTMVQDGSENGALLYVPDEANNLAFGQINQDDGPTIPAQLQARALERFVGGNDYLSDRRGQYAERNGDRTPWESVVDLSLRVEVFQQLLGRRQSVELTADVFNFSSLLGDLVGQDHWGERFASPSEGKVSLTSFREFEDADNGNYTPVYTAQQVIDQVSDTNGDGVADQVQTLDQEEIFNQLRTGSTYSSQWQMKFGVRYNF